eukprot:jgi/Mesvir1/26661/Mv20448-RA.3
MESTAMQGAGLQPAFACRSSNLQQKHRQLRCKAAKQFLGQGVITRPLQAHFEAKHRRVVEVYAGESKNRRGNELGGSKLHNALGDSYEVNDDHIIDTKGAGLTWAAPTWLTELFKMGQKRDDGIPVADTQLEDVKELLSGALFLPLHRWAMKYGPAYRLAAGPQNFVILSSPEYVKHVLRNYAKYEKGMMREVAEFLFGTGFAIADGEVWKVSRRATVPALHKKYLEVMVDTTFGDCVDVMVDKLAKSAAQGKSVNMEDIFSQMTLDVIGRAVFNYDFGSLTTNSPLIQAVYTALKEAESRTTDLLPYWKSPLLCMLVPRQRKARAAVEVIRAEVGRMVAECKRLVEEEGALTEMDEEQRVLAVNTRDPSILRFLLESRAEVSSLQMRDDLLSLLVAGHETTGSALTWTAYLLAKHPDKLKKAQEEAMRVVKGSHPTFAETMQLPYITRCICESLRLYPHPPVFLRRCVADDELPGGAKISKGQDIMIAIYNVHHNPDVWENAEEFVPERFPLDQPVPNETNTDFKYIPFSGGPRKCVGDQFALLETMSALAGLLKRFDMSLTPGHKVDMITGATIHTANVSTWFLWPG